MREGEEGKGRRMLADCGGGDHDRGGGDGVFRELGGGSVCVACCESERGGLMGEEDLWRVCLGAGRVARAVG